MALEQRFQARHHRRATGRRGICDGTDRAQRFLAAGNTAIHHRDDGGCVLGSGVYRRTGRGASPQPIRGDS